MGDLVGAQPRGVWIDERAVPHVLRAVALLVAELAQSPVGVPRSVDVLARELNAVVSRTGFPRETGKPVPAVDAAPSESWNPRDVISTPEAALLLGVSRQMARRLVAGLPSAEVVSGRWQVPRTEVEELVNERAQRAG